MKINYKYNLRTNQNPKYSGIDINHEISLFEYNFLVKKAECEGSTEDEYFVIYKIDENVFGTSFVIESELNDLVSGKEWASKEDCNRFLEFVDCKTVEEWIGYSIICKLSGLFPYWGFENILGTEYYPLNLKNVLRIYMEAEK